MDHHKLVRDNIPTIIEQQHKTPITHIADEKEYHLELYKKLQEEVSEFLHDESVEELADILEVIYALARHEFHITPQELELLREEKAAKRGRFKKRIILEKVK